MSGSSSLALAGQEAEPRRWHSTPPLSHATRLDHSLDVLAPATRDEQVGSGATDEGGSNALAFPILDGSLHLGELHQCLGGLPTMQSVLSEQIGDERPELDDR